MKNATLPEVAAIQRERPRDQAQADLQDRLDLARKHVREVLAQRPLPDQLPPGVDRAEAEASYESAANSPLSWERLAAQAFLSEKMPDTFPPEIFAPKGAKAPRRKKAEEAKPAEEPERPARLRSLEAENHLLLGLIRRPKLAHEVMELTSSEEFGSLPNRRIMRAIEVRAEHSKPIDFVLLRADLAGDETAAATQALAALDSLLTLVAPSGERVLEYARLINQKHVEHLLELKRRELGRILQDPKIRNGTLQAAAGDILGQMDLLESKAEPELQIKSWPEPAGPEAYHGVAGEILNAVAPATIADEMAILGQFFAAFSNMAGRNPCFLHERTRHALNLFLVVAGPTSKGCKGTSLDVALSVLEDCDPTWCDHTGLISGEGLIHAVRDASHEVQGNGKEKQLTLGVEDKRLLFVEREFGSTLVVKGRKGSTLSHHLRLVWDGYKVGIASRNDPISASGYHISLIGHGTFDEIEDLFSSKDIANGLGNRIAWCCSRQSKDASATRGAPQPDWEANGVRRKIRKALLHARSQSSDKLGLVLERDAEAQDLWHKVEPQLATPGPGLLGALKGRARPMVMRLAGIYAILDCDYEINVKHLRAALAYWGYLERSCAYVFGDRAGDPTHGKILEAISAAGTEGLSQRAISRKFFRSKTDKAAFCLSRMVRDGLIREAPGSVKKFTAPSVRGGS